MSLSLMSGCIGGPRGGPVVTVHRWAYGITFHDIMRNGRSTRIMLHFLMREWGPPRTRVPKPMREGGRASVLFMGEWGPVVYMGPPFSSSTDLPLLPSTQPQVPPNVPPFQWAPKLLAQEVGLASQALHNNLLDRAPPPPRPTSHPLEVAVASCYESHPAHLKVDLATHTAPPLLASCLHVGACSCTPSPSACGLGPELNPRGGPIGPLGKPRPRPLPGGGSIWPRPLTARYGQNPHLAVLVCGTRVEAQTCQLLAAAQPAQVEEGASGVAQSQCYCSQEAWLGLRRSCCHWLEAVSVGQEAQWTQAPWLLLVRVWVCQPLPCSGLQVCPVHQS